MPDRIACLLDGGFVTKRLHRQNGKFPTAAEVSDLCSRVLSSEHLAEKYELYRAFFYDSYPYQGKKKNPLSGETTTFGSTTVARQHESLLDSLEQTKDFAVRRGELIFVGWKVGRASFKDLVSGKQTAVTGESLVPDIAQKGVDMRIGLDIAALALKRLVSAVLLITGDSDMLPAMKFARREGLRVYLHTLGMRAVRSELKRHADIIV